MRGPAFPWDKGFHVTRLTERFEEALVFATRLHAEQRRKGTSIPYPSHLLIVAGYVLEDGGSEDEAIAALLHDAVEDQGGEPLAREIRERFGARVEALVLGCTDADTVPKPPWRERKERYVASIRQKSRETRRISAADKLHNARAILRDFRVHGPNLWDRFNGGRDGTLWYYRALADVFLETETGFLAEELERTVVELERLASS